MLTINKTRKIFNSFALVASLTASTASFAMELDAKENTSLQRPSPTLSKLPPVEALINYVNTHTTSMRPRQEDLIKKTYSECSDDVNLFTTAVDTLVNLKPGILRRHAKAIKEGLSILALESEPSQKNPSPVSGGSIASHLPPVDALIQAINVANPNINLKEAQESLIRTAYSQSSGDVTKFKSEIDALVIGRKILRLHALTLNEELNRCQTQGSSKNEQPILLEKENPPNPYFGEGPLKEGTLYPTGTPDFRPYWLRGEEPTTARESMKTAYRHIYHQNQEIMKRGYTTKNGVTVTPEDLGIENSMSRSVKSSPVLDQNRIDQHPEQKIQFLQTDTVSGARYLLENGHENVDILNFANRNHVGGGYTTGALAQEEDLCRNSTLYSILDALREKGLYPINHDELIYSPDVVVIRNGSTNDFELRDMPFKFGVLTQGAFNLNGSEKGTPLEKFKNVTGQKIRQQIAAAANHGADALVLGAFGCGAFANDPKIIASLYREALEEPQHKGLFKTVLFAIPGGTKNYETFFKAFEGLATEVVLTPPVLTSANTKPLKEEVEQPVVAAHVPVVPKGRSVELFEVQEQEGVLSLNAPANKPSRIWFYKDHIGEETKKPDYQKQPWSVEETQKVNVSFDISNLEGQGVLFFAFIGVKFDQLQAWPITTSGPKSFSYTVQKGTTGLTPMFLGNTKSLKLKDFKVTITD